MLTDHSCMQKYLAAQKWLETLGMLAAKADVYATVGVGVIS